MTNIINIKGTREAPKSVSSKMDTLIFSVEEVSQWLIPPFQRPLRVNDRVRAVAEELKNNGGVISGVVTLGRVAGVKTMWLVDGQHRIEAFKISGLPECIADVRLCNFASMGEMADEFVNLNSSLVKMRPDDILRGLEASLPLLAKLRQDCPFVGYDQLRRNTASPVVGMAVVLRAWAGAGGETPTGTSIGKSAATLAQELTADTVDHLTEFLRLARTAWGSDPGCFRLWSGLNLTMCIWIYRRLVIATERDAVKRTIYLSQQEFQRCLMSVAASQDYVDWLLGRVMNDRDRSPCYSRLKAIFVRRLRVERPGSNPKMLQPVWAGG